MKIKLNELKHIIQEEVIQCKIDMLNENIVRDMWSLILGNKVNKIAKQYKNQPEYKELERKIKQSSAELEIIAARLEKTINDKDSLIKKYKKQGYDFEPGMSYKDMYAKLDKEYADLKKRIPGSALNDIEKMSS